MRVRLLIAVFAALLLAPIADAQEDVEFMKVAELRQLLARGPVLAFFKTVTEGSTLSTYDITIKGVDDGTPPTVIVFTARRAIAGGMSGSPVYVIGLDGKRKLLGAVAYQMSQFPVDLHWGGISPIEYMHAEAQGAAPLSAAHVRASFTYEGKTFVPISTKPTVQATTTVSAIRSWPLAPGMPISVDILEWTDQNGVSSTMSATGTITHIGKDGEIYAFGHPFLGARTARYRFRTCKIMGTIYSHARSNKVSGEQSFVLGTIEYDGAYGIYGKIGGVSERPVTEFTMDFSASGKSTGSYRVRMATSSLTSVIMGAAFGIIGEVAKVPLSEQASTAAFAATVELEGHEPIEFSQLYTSTRFQFGPSTIENSSYENAAGAFMEGIYIPLSVSRLGFKITKTRLSFDFTSGIAPSLKIARVKFPTKLKWGQDPVLELLLVSEDNKTTLTKRTVIALDWDKIEKPTYTAETKDTEKQGEKIVGGSLSVYTVDYFGMFLADNERETETPLYFLDAKDYLMNFRRHLGRSNRMLYGRVSIRKRSGLDEVANQPAQQSTADPGGGTPDWILEHKGLSERKVTVQKELFARFSANLPPVPPGYMVAPVQKTLIFEVVN